MAADALAALRAIRRNNYHTPEGLHRLRVAKLDFMGRARGDSNFDGGRGGD